MNGWMRPRFPMNSYRLQIERRGMSIYSDYKCGALSDDEYRNICNRENARERAYVDDFERLYEEEADEEIDEEENPLGFNPWQE